MILIAILKQIKLSDILLYIFKDFYKELKDQGKDFGGIYTLKKQSLIINDPQLIGEATIKHFDHFVNRRPMVDQRFLY
jgi:hypothetical protein